MRTKIKWAEVHAPIFIGTDNASEKGINLGQKLDTRAKVGLDMEYDEEKRQLYVKFQGRTVRVPEPSILSMIEGEPVAPVVEDKPQLPKINKKITAQVSGPQSHVHAGPGAGRTGQ